MTNETHAKILIVDDSRTQLERLRFLLEENEYLVTGALNGAEAIEKARIDKPDLIISDVLMPVMDGYELCRVVKQDEELQSIPLMLLTTLSNAEDIILGLNARADYYITKPYDSHHLLDYIADILTQEAESSIRSSGEGDLSVLVAGKRYFVQADRRQMLSVIMSTYDHAVQRNRELIAAQSELQKLNDELHSQQEKLKQANTKLEELATVDGLTGLKNHRAFQARLEEELARAVRYDVPLSLLLLDVDQFKLFNDTFGHPAGDDVLRQVGQLMLHTARETDFAARYGGEEFTVIMPNTDSHGALVCCERIRSAIEQSGWSHRSITASLGASTLLGREDSRASLIQRADTALYRSKHGGRNRSTHARDL